VGKNLDELSEIGVKIPAFSTELESQVFEAKAERSLEVLRRTDFDITGEHLDYARTTLESIGDWVKENISG